MKCTKDLSWQEYIGGRDFAGNNFGGRNGKKTERADTG
jgi:hypothetical protein